MPFPTLTRRRRALPWVALLLGLLATLGIWRDLQDAQQTRLDELVNFQADATMERIERRMTGIIQVLQGAAADLSRPPMPTRAEWARYVESLDLPRIYPGIQGVAFAQWIPTRERAAHEQQVRAGGFPDYRMSPGGPLPADPDGCSSILYHHPMDDRNLRAIGKDMLSEAVRREAMIRARDTGLPALTGPVTLYQETVADVQTGTILFVPVYRQGAPLVTVVDRRRALLGWTCGVFRMTDLMEATLGRRTFASNLELYDLTRPAEPVLLYDSDPRIQLGHGPNALDRKFDLGGRTWDLKTRISPTELTSLGRRMHWEIPLGGGLISLLLFGLLRAMLGAEIRALGAVKQKEAELLASEARFVAFFRKSVMVNLIIDPRDGRIVEASESAVAFYGWPLEELLGKRMQDINTLSAAEVQAEMARAMRGEKSHFRFKHRLATGDTRDVEVYASHIEWNGRPLLHSVIHDVTERTRLETVLHESEARYRLVADNAGDVIWLLDIASQRLEYISPSIERLRGVSVPEALEESWRDKFTEAEARKLEELLRRRLKGYRHEDPSTWSFLDEVDQVRKDGTLVPTEVATRFLADDSGRPTRILGVSRDISERKQAEDRLRASEARLRFLSDSLPDSFIYQYSVTADGTPRFLYLSAGVEWLLGVKAEDALRDAGFLLGQIDSALLPAYIEAEAASAASLEPFVMELRIRREDGVWRWFRLRSRPRRQADGSVVWEGISTDITGQVENRIALQDSETRLRSLVENAADAIYLHDAEGRFLFCNPQASRMTGYSHQEFLGMTVWDLDPTQSKEQLLGAWNGRAIDQHFTFQGYNRRKDGSSFPVEVRVGLLREAEPRQFLALVRDVSDREQMREADLRAKKAESLVLMAGSIAHDFNNLFQALLSSLEMAEVKSKDNPQAIPPLRTGKDVLRRAVALSWKMLDFSGRAATRARPEDLAKLLAGWAVEFGQKLDGAAKLELELGEVPKVSADAEKLRMVVDALLDNAREALEESGRGGGRVRLKLFVDFGEDRPGPQSRGVWAADPPSGAATVCLEVADDGPGVNPTVLTRMFDPFFTTKEMGRGLGLPSALGLLQAHRAGVHALPGENGGLVFRIHFPPVGT